MVLCTRHFTRFVIMVTMAGSVIGCEDKEPETPEEVVRQFKAELRSHRFEEASMRVWPETLEAMQVAAKSDDADDLFAVTRVNSLFLMERGRVIGESPTSPSVGEAITMRVTYRDEREASFDLRWSGEEWLVDLPMDGEEFSLTERAPEEESEAEVNAVSPDELKDE